MTASAKPVSTQAAQRAAATFLHIDEGSLREIPLRWESLHLFSIDKGGFVLTSADSRVQPVLGYSLNGNSLRTDGKRNESFEYWLESYDAQIQAVMADESAREHPQWSMLLAGTTPKAVYVTAVGPLLETEWGQCPYYNELCPANASGEKTVTGCVATAMGQVMRYWQWPDMGVGTHSYTSSYYGVQSADFGATTYDWSHMPTRLTAVSDSISTMAVATLLYHCGVAVDMMYGTLSQNGSGAYDIMEDGDDLHTPCAENALRTFFKYSPALTGARRENFTQSEWATLLKDEIDHRRPVLYAGSGPAGAHEFVCDGYDTNGFFSFNWGFDGEDNGFFSLGNVAIDVNYAFNLYQVAILGIEPDTIYGSGVACTVTAVSADTSRGSVTGGGVYSYRDTVTLTAIPAEGCRFLCWSNGAALNPYQILAHDMSLEAIFTGALREENDTLSYTGTETQYTGLYSMPTTNRIGIKIPAEYLQGHNYLTAVDNYMHNHPVAVNIHLGGNDAPGTLVHTQHYQGTEGTFSWYRIVLDSAIALPPDSNLWVVIQPLDDDIIFGAKGINVPDANWFSNNNGATWGHLNDYQPPYSFCNRDIAWLIRCITSPAASVGIEEMEISDVTITTRSLLLTVDNPDRKTVRLYDMMGRLLTTSRLTTSTFHLPSPGIYLVKIDNRPAKKIVAIR